MVNILEDKGEPDVQIQRKERQNSGPTSHKIGTTTIKTLRKELS